MASSRRMLNGLLALALTAMLGPRSVAVYPMRHPEGRDAQAEALRTLLADELRRRAVGVITAAPDAFAGCTTEACLALRAPQYPNMAAVVPSWTGFGSSSVVSAMVLDDLSGQTFSVAVPVQGEGDLVRATLELSKRIGDRLGLAPEGSPPFEPERDTFGLSLKAGNTLGNLAGVPSKISGFNLRFDLEGDYLAAPEFWPFVDLSVVLAHENGHNVQLIPLLLGAKYVFRKGTRLRPYLGLALGLNFLSADLDRDTGSGDTFAVYGVGGLDFFVLPDVAVALETNGNLNGLQASGGSGLLFALGFNLGAVVLF